MGHLFQALHLSIHTSSLIPSFLGSTTSLLGTTLCSFGVGHGFGVNLLGLFQFKAGFGHLLLGATAAFLCFLGQAGSLLFSSVLLALEIGLRNTSRK
jgi:hypothetical protein